LSLKLFGGPLILKPDQLKRVAKDSLKKPRLIFIREMFAGDTSVMNIAGQVSGD
jgi:hypothetical protein